MNQLAHIQAGSITVVEGVGTLGLALLLFIPSLALTLGALWLATRLAPWFLNQRLEPQTVRSFFFDFVAETELTQARITTVMLAAAIVLAVLTPIVCAIRFGGFAV